MRLLFLKIGVGMERFPWKSMEWEVFTNNGDGIVWDHHITHIINIRSENVV